MAPARTGANARNEGAAPNPLHAATGEHLLTATRALTRLGKADEPGRGVQPTGKHPPVDARAALVRDPSTVTALVKKLTRLELTQTSRSPIDGRAVVVSLTERDASARRGFEEISSLLQSTWLTCASDEDLATTSRVLATVAENLERAIGSSTDTPQQA